MRYIGIISKTAFIFISAAFFSLFVFIITYTLGDSYNYDKDGLDKLLSIYEEEGIPIPKDCFKNPILFGGGYYCDYKGIAELAKPSISEQTTSLIEAVHVSSAFIIGALSFFLSIIIVYLVLILHRLKQT